MGALQTLAQLRAFATEQHAPGSTSDWLAHRLADYLNQRGATTLENTFGLKPGRGEAPWWKQEAMAARDKAIKRVAQPLSGRPVAEQARQVLAAAERYRQGRWCFDQEREANYSDPQTEALHRMLTATGGRVPTGRVIRDALR